jgi:hypothetical protein
MGQLPLPGFPRWRGRGTVFQGGAPADPLFSGGRQNFARRSCDPLRAQWRTGAASEVNGRLSFDDLLQHIHPAASRVEMLARNPVRLIVFDLLVNEKGESLTGRTLTERQEALEAFHGKFLGDLDGIALSRATRNLKVAQGWLKQTRGQLDGIVAKRVDRPYRSGERATLKIKIIRSADCVVGGFCYASARRSWDRCCWVCTDHGVLNHVGFTSSMTYCRAQGSDHAVGKPDRTARLYGKGAWRAQSLEHRLLGGMAAAQTGAGGRGAVRPLYRRALPPRYEIHAMAAR